MKSTTQLLNDEVKKAYNKTRLGGEILVEWPDSLKLCSDYMERQFAIDELAVKNLAEWRKIPNGFSGFDFALYKL